jgi:hypothetical protein
MTVFVAMIVVTEIIPFNSQPVDDRQQSFIAKLILAEVQTWYFVIWIDFCFLIQKT